MNRAKDGKYNLFSGFDIVFMIIGVVMCQLAISIPLVTDKKSFLVYTFRTSIICVNNHYRVCIDTKNNNFFARLLFLSFKMATHGLERDHFGHVSWFWRTRKEIVVWDLYISYHCACVSAFNTKLRDSPTRLHIYT